MALLRWKTDVQPILADLEPVRFWDLASTKPLKASDDPDWTAGALLGVTTGRNKGVSKGRWILLDMYRFRETPGRTDELLWERHLYDDELFKPVDRRVPVRVEREGGASGKRDIDHLARGVFNGVDFQGQSPDGSKVDRAKPVSRAAEAGNFDLLEAPWNDEFLDEAELFPESAHDDMCFPAEVQVLRSDGPVSIAHVRVGDMVLGQSGWVRVERAGCTGNCLTLDRGWLRATTNHPVWTGRGFVPLSEIRDDDEVSVCSQLLAQSRAARTRSLSSRAAGATCTTSAGTGSAIRTRRSERDERRRAQSRAARLVATSSAGSAISTTRGGSDTATLSPSTPPSEEASESRLSSSTGSPFGATRTPTTLRTPATSSPAASGSTRAFRLFTKRSGRLLTVPSLMATRFTTETGTLRITTSRTLSASRAQITAPSMPRSSPESCVRSVSWLTSPQSGLSLRPGTGARRGEPGTVNTPARWMPREPVYNLTTSDGTFYADGILVHNCDALSGAFKFLADRVMMSAGRPVVLEQENVWGSVGSSR